jgi:serine/threonine-protein kinase
MVYRSYAALSTAPPTTTPTPLVTRTPEAVKVTVPNVVDRPVDEARRMLQRTGLELEIATEREEPGVEQGIVLEQSPTSGESVATGTTVLAVVSKPGRELVMPDVVGRSAEAMQEGLESMGLEVAIERTWATEPEGLVVAQQPEADATVRAGDTVTLTVSGESEIPLGVNLDRKILLKGAVIQQQTLSPGDMFGIALRWQAIAAIDRRYVVFVHLIGPDGSLFTQDDRQPSLPTTEWIEGIEIVDPHQLRIPAGVPPGRYQLRTGMYPDGQPGNRLAVVSAGSTTQVANSILITEIDVAP